MQLIEDSQGVRLMNISHSYRLLLLAALTPMLLAVSGRAEDRVLKLGKAEQVGMSGPRLERVIQILTDETKSGRVTAASILVARRGVIVLRGGWGTLSPDAASAKAGPETVYIVASISKPITVLMLMLLVERGQVSLNDPVQKYLPEFQGPGREKVRVKDLLTHTSGLPDMLPENVKLREANAPLARFVKGAMTTPLLFEPRTSFKYSSMGTLLAAEIVERVAKMPLAQFEQRELFDRLKMKHSSLGLGEQALKDTAIVQGDSFAKAEKDLARYGANSPYLRKLSHPWGGMHSTVDDLGIVLQMFLNGGVYDGKRILGRAAVEAMIEDQNQPLRHPWGLGWGLQTSSAWNAFGDLSSNRTFGHSGASGTVAWADPRRELLCVVLTTRPWREDRGFLLRRISNVVQAAVE
ncbi:MAG: beta-lactamase family protein [Planctomycetes bacterium]|nr:beta-lactamase family protein [Planctomycetota bacterium]